MDGASVPTHATPSRSTAAVEAPAGMDADQATVPSRRYARTVLPDATVTPPP